MTLKQKLSNFKFSLNNMTDKPTTFHDKKIAGFFQKLT
jgi:hypothetical protein